jgi:PKD repeat protein
MLQSIRPAVDDVIVCYGSKATINATGANRFNWYKNFDGGAPIHSGSSFTTGNLFSDTILYVSNAEQTYESVRTAAHINLKANPAIFTSGSTLICDGSKVTLSVAEAGNYFWSTGAKTQSIEVSAAGNYSVNVVDNLLHCNSNSKMVEVKVNPSPISEFMEEGDLTTLSSISFVNKSTGATSYKWNFGDGFTSIDANPSHTYLVMQNYNVSLIATNDLGCASTNTASISIITGLEKESSFHLYPIPAAESVIVQMGWERMEHTITDVTGRIYISSSIQKTGNDFVVDVHALPSGVYILSISDGRHTFRRKFIKN